jgi:predicted dehydrogenase
MSEFGWALIGPGRIARRFAAAVQGLPDSRLARVYGRDAQRAAAFAADWSAPGRPPPRVATELPALLADPAVDAVYIATPHAQHGELLRLCLQAGKPVLCEKPLVPSLAIAEPLLALAIGPLRGIQSSFCFSAAYDPGSRLFNPALAGGALLDIGIYNLTATRWVLQQALGACPEPLAIEARGLLAPTGVDQRVNATLSFPGGLASQFICAFDSSADNALRIFGERGVISLPTDFWQATEAQLQIRGQAAERVQAPFRINGFEGEIEEAQACIRAGRVESAVMPHAETRAVLGWMDEIRRQLGVRYPFE